MHTYVCCVSVKPLVTWCKRYHQGLLILWDKNDVEETQIYTNLCVSEQEHNVDGCHKSRQWTARPHIGASVSDMALRVRTPSEAVDASTLSEILHARYCFSALVHKESCTGTATHYTPRHTRICAHTYIYVCACVYTSDRLSGYEKETDGIKYRDLTGISDRRYT